MKQTIKSILAFAAVLLCGGAWAGVTSVTPKLLVNFDKSANAAVDGWIKEDRAGTQNIPSSGTLTDNGISFATSEGAGKLRTDTWVTPAADYATGSYVDIFNTQHDSVIDEIKASLCMPDLVLTEAVYKTGFLNGGANGNKGTISGLSADKRYLVYIGFGLLKSDSRTDTTQTHTFKMESSGYGEAISLQYVKAGASGDATSYSDYSVGDTLTASVSGLMLVRLNGITPNASGNIAFTMPSGRSGFNFLAVAEMELSNVAAIEIGGETTTYTTLASAAHAATNAAAAESPVTIKLIANTNESVALTEHVILDPNGNSYTGAISGTGTVKLSNNSGSSTSIAAMLGADLTSFQGTLWLNQGRYEESSEIASNVKIKITDGGQLWTKGGTWANAITVSGNGWSTGDAIENAAIRNDGATISGTITAVVENDVTPTIGTYNSTSTKFTGNIICPDGVKLIASDSSAVVNITGAIKGSATDNTATCKVEKIGSGRVHVKTLYAGDVKISGGDLRLYEATVAANVNFEIASGNLTCWGWPTFNGAWSIKTDATLDVLNNVGATNPACIRKGEFTKKGTGKITMQLFLGNGDGGNNYKGSVTVEGGELILNKNCNFDSTTEISIANGATLSVANSVSIGGAGSFSIAEGGKFKQSGTVNGVFKGTGKICGNNFTFGNSTTIDVTGNAEGAALTVDETSTLAFGTSINLKGVTEGSTILKGFTSQPDVSLIDATVDGSRVTGAHLYYEDGAVKYSSQTAAQWEPRDSAIENNIFDWCAEGAWTDLSGNTVTWPSDQATASAMNITLNATVIKGIKITGQVYVGTLTVDGALGEGESFQFYNHLLEAGVDNDHEVNPEGEGHDCLHATMVKLTSLEGGLGLKVPIKGQISFGEDTDLTFKTGPKGGTPSTAYDYNFIDRGGSIKVAGDGRFIVPSSMYGMAFEVKDTATAVYQESSKAITGAITGTGTVEFKNGVTKDIGGNAQNQTLHYVSTGVTTNTLAWVGNGSTSFTTTDSKSSPVVTVESDATLKLHGHDFSGWNGGLTEHGWVVNNGKLIFSKPTNTRFWRDHIVFGPNSTMQIDTGDHHVYLYGGVGSADNCQLTLASGTATIEKGAVNSGKSNYALYIGFTSSTGYASDTAANKGAGINVGENARLTVSVPLMGGDPMTKYGAGTLILSDVSSYTGTITLKGGAITVPAKLDEGRIITDEKILKFDEATKTYSLVDPVAKIVGTPTRYFETLREAIDAAGDHLESIIVLDQDAEVPEGYDVLDGHIAKLVVDGDVISLSNKSAGSTNRSNFDSSNTFKLTIPVSAGRPSGTKVMVRYVDIGYDYESTDASLVHYMEINGVRSKEVAYTANHYATSEHRLRYEFEGLVLDCGTEYAITMLNASKSAHTGPRFLLRKLSDAATANATAVIHDSKYSDNGDIYCIYSEVTANAVVNKLAANYVGDAYTSYGTAAEVVTAAKAGVVGLVSNVTLSPAAGDVLTIVKNGNTVTISGTPQALETTYVGVTTYDVFKRIIYQTSSTGYLCSTSFACSHSDHGVIEGTTPFNLSSDGTGSAVGWEEGDVIVITHTSKYYIGPGLSGKTFIVPSGKEFSLYQTGATGASFVNAKVYVVGTVNQSGSTIKNSSFILRGGTLKVTESYTGTLAITGYGTATKNDAALALPFYGVKPESDEEEVVIEEVVETVEIVPNTNIKVPVDTDVSKIKVKYGTTDLTGGDSPKVTVAVNPSSGKVELEATESAKPTVSAMAMPTTQEEGDQVTLTITPIPGLFYSIVTCDTPNGSFTGGDGEQATTGEAKTLSIAMPDAQVKYFKVRVKATK